MSTTIEYRGGDYFTLRFPYHRHFLRFVRNLARREWDPEDKCWHIHIAHLRDVMDLFQFRKEELPAKLWRAYMIYRIRTTRLRVSVGPTVARLEGTNIPIEEIVQKTSYLVPGHQYNPLFIGGRWDGKKSLFDRRQLTFPAGLKDRVCEVLRAHKIPFDVCEEVTPPSPSIRYRKLRFELRDYQEKCVAAALDSKRGVLELATGAGKTVIAAQIISELGLPTIFFVHTRDLLHQTHEFFQAHLHSKVGLVGDGHVHLAPLTVATLQTVGKAFDISIPAPTDEEGQSEEDATDVSRVKKRLISFVQECPVVFFDECHHIPAESFYSLAMRTGGAVFRYGLSATPYRADKLDLLLEAAIGPKVFRANASSLIENGYLVPPEITFLAPSAYRFASSRHLDYATVFYEYVVANHERNELIVKTARKLAAQNKSVLILVSQVVHGERLAALMPEAAFVQGNDSATKRRRVFRKLETKEQPLVIATSLADEGLDVPTLDAVILASGGKSETRTLQRIGRVLRPAPGKEKAHIIDFFDNAPFLKDHSLRRYELYSTEPLFTVRTEGFTI
ncbi:MAG: DEAD/DEAH box helicase [Candidatus Sumerlaeaceae bacterium]